MLNLIPHFPNIRAIWWLSVDNFFKLNNFDSFDDLSFIHLYQSSYAHHFLMQKNVCFCYPLFDYISFSTYKKKKKDNIVVVNPNKGLMRMVQVAKWIDIEDAKFVAIQNMSSDEVSDLLSRSKVYMDLGKHPGKDRIPREAAWHDNVVITSLNGSAFFYDDVPIPNDYKFNYREHKKIADKVMDCINNYDDYICDFEHYKRLFRIRKTIFCTSKRFSGYSLMLNK